MNPATCPDAFCSGTLRNGKCMACGIERRQWSREDMQDWAETARDDEEPPFDANGWEVVGGLRKRDMTRITLTDAIGEELEVDADLSGMVLTLANDASKATSLVDIMAAHRHFHVGFDPASGPETSVIYVVDAGDVVHILPESEARGHTIRELPPKKPGQYAPDHAYNLPKLMEQQLRAFSADSWDVAPPTWYVPDDGPNAGRQAPPPRREWWTEQWKGKGTPGNGRQKQDKRARKAQKQARKANRSK